MRRFLLVTRAGPTPAPAVSWASARIRSVSASPNPAAPPGPDRVLDAIRRWRNRQSVARATRPAGSRDHPVDTWPAWPARKPAQSPADPAPACSCGGFSSAFEIDPSGQSFPPGRPPAPLGGTRSPARRNWPCAGRGLRSAAIHESVDRLQPSQAAGPRPVAASTASRSAAAPDPCRPWRADTASGLPAPESPGRPCSANQDRVGRGHPRIGATLMKSSGLLRSSASRRCDFRHLARVTGLEPATSGVTGRHSNQLSYTRIRRCRRMERLGALAPPVKRETCAFRDRPSAPPIAWRSTSLSPSAQNPAAAGPATAAGLAFATVAVSSMSRCWPMFRLASTSSPVAALPAGLHLQLAALRRSPDRAAPAQPSP